MRRLLFFMAQLRCARALQHIARPALRRTHLLATRSELEALTVPVLKDRLRSLSLKVGGKKGELVERLLASDASDAATPEDANGAAAAEAEPVVVDGFRVIDVGDDYDWGFDDDDDLIRVSLIWTYKDKNAYQACQKLHGQWAKIGGDYIGKASGYRGNQIWGFD